LIVDPRIKGEVRGILGDYGLPGEALTLSDGFANLVVLTPDHVVRLNEGRFPDAFRHEARVLAKLPGDIPHPVAVAHGPRAAGGEYLILERLPGDNLRAVWPALSPADRHRIVEDLAGLARRLHALPAADWMRNPWVDEVLALRRWGDAYHARPQVSALLIESARSARPDLRDALAETSRFIDERLHAFDCESTAFVHTDLHFRNVIVANGQITGLIDFEGSRTGPPDVELDMLLRTLAPPGEGQMSAYAGAIGTFRSAYPGLFGHPLLIDRLEVYEALWHLVQLHHWKPGDRWTDDPAVSLGEVLQGTFAARLRQVLDGSCTG
jgi:aminoglycoside phosphotransferase (APT) family kinase protein